MRIHVFTLLLVMSSLTVFSQAERKYIRKGNQAYQEKNFTQSEVNYRKALEKDAGSFEATFNVGDALYKQEKYKEAAEKFSSLTNQDVSDEKLARAYHNMGNALLKTNKLKKSINAYKHALRLNPGDMETKHNLTYALRKLKQQQQKKKQQQQQNQQQKQQQDQQKKNEKKQQQDQQDQQGQQQQRQQQQKKQDRKKQQQPQSGEKQRISKEDAKRLLQALENDEKQLQKKLKKKKAKSVKVKTTKNW
jgi:tetratricopeptide (TPR) repeat protein